MISSPTSVTRLLTEAARDGTPRHRGTKLASLMVSRKEQLTDRAARRGAVADPGPPRYENMRYRVVLQGRAIGGADIEHVKREFVRVTGLPAAVAEDYFNGMPQPIKRQVARADAERIAATLRAIGAGASVEREVDDPDDDEHGEIHIAANPLIIGPPTVIPGSDAGTLAAVVVPRPRWMRELRAKLPAIGGVVALVVAALYFAPEIDGFVQALTPASAPATVVAAPAKRALAVVPPAASATRDATLLYGPWRCTDQRTGVATYWTYRDDGAVVFHGDTLKDGASAAGPAADEPRTWQLAGDDLVITSAQGSVIAFAVEALTLTNLRYGDAGRRIAIDCRRP